MKPTQPTTDELKKHLHESMLLLKTLRDEIRVELHLAGMEARERWKKLEHRFANAERVARECTHDSKQVVDETVDAFKSFKASFPKDAASKHTS
jgi:hypothetical protein